MMRKKGVSPIVAVIAIALLTVAAVSFIAGYLVPFVRDQLEEGSGCIDYREYFTFDDSFGFNCYENKGTYYLTGISVRGDSVSDKVENNVKGFELLFVTSGDSAKVEVYEGLAEGLNDGEIRMLNSDGVLYVPESGGVRTYVYRSANKVSRVEIYPVLKNNDRLCDMSDEMDVSTVVCKSGSELE